MSRSYSNDELKKYYIAAIENIDLLISHCDDSYDEVFTYKRLLFDSISNIVNNKIFDVMLHRDELNCLGRWEELYMNKKNIKIKVTCKSACKLHLWGWQYFKERIDGDIVDYEVDGNIILSITYVVATLPIKELLDEYGLKYEIIE